MYTQFRTDRRNNSEPTSIRALTPSPGTGKRLERFFCRAVLSSHPTITAGRTRPELGPTSRALQGNGQIACVMGPFPILMPMDILTSLVFRSPHQRSVGSGTQGSEY